MNENTTAKKEKGNIYTIQKTLLRLGMSMNYKGFRLCSYAIYLAVKDTDNLLAVTTKLYPATAEHYGTDYSCVERNIRTVIDKAWATNPVMMSKLAGHTLTAKPTASQFISIIAFHFLDRKNEKDLS